MIYLRKFEENPSTGSKDILLTRQAITKGLTQNLDVKLTTDGWTD